MEKIDHIAVVVPKPIQAAKWYTDNFDCNIKYKDNTMVILEFNNIDLALVSPAEHPPHIAIVDENLDENHSLSTVILRIPRRMKQIVND